MIDMAKSNDPEDVYNLQSTIGALYFGVPGQGMRVEEMATMIQNLPARYTANLLDKDLGFRQRAKFEDDFQRALIYNDITIFLFYEEEKTKTLRMVMRHRILEKSRALTYYRIRKHKNGIETVLQYCWSSQILPHTVVSPWKTKYPCAKITSTWSNSIKVTCNTVESFHRSPS